MAASGVIALLMLAGMAELLFPAVCLLYVLGFVGAIDALIHRHRPDWKLMPGMGGLIIFLVWRCYFCPLYRIDDLSHWGLVARHLLQHNRFPGNGDELILFQSYPLGSVCWIYYVGRFIENSEGMYFVAQNFLMGLLFLPLFALIRKQPNVLYPACTVLFFAMIYGFYFLLTLQVDVPGQYYVCASQARLPAEMLDDGEQPAPDAQQGGNVFGVHGSHVALLPDYPSAFIADELDNTDALLILGDDADLENIVKPTAR